MRTAHPARPGEQPGCKERHAEHEGQAKQCAKRDEPSAFHAMTQNVTVREFSGSDRQFWPLGVKGFRLSVRRMPSENRPKLSTEGVSPAVLVAMAGMWA